LPADTALPSFPDSGFYSLTRTADEISIVCEEQQMPENAKSEKGWRALRVIGVLDFALTGILARLTAPLANAGISIFALSTFDTDYLLVKQEKLAEAIAVLSDAGYTIER
jgi:hypothetical protein